MLVLFFIVFGLGDVCPPNPDNHDLCLANGVLYYDAYGDMRSGRPQSYDAKYETYADSCIAPFNASNPATYLVVNMTKVPNRPEGYCATEFSGHSSPSRHFTLLFTSFVMMQLVNQINSRKLHGEQNVFVGIMENKFFISIMAMEFFMQFVMVQTPGVNLAMGCKALDMYDWALCIFIGLTELPINLVISYLPLEWFQPRSSIKGFDSRGGDKAEKRDIPLQSRERDDAPMLSTKERS